jgi:hypothetical protein
MNAVDEKMADKKIKISSSLDIQSESLHEKIKDNKTGQTRVVDIQEPHRTTKTTTITTNPVKYEAKGPGKVEVTEGKAVDINPATVGYDTSQL